MLTAFACSVFAVLNAECAVGCKWLGYTNGCFEAQAEVCACVDQKEYHELAKSRRLRLPRKTRSRVHLNPPIAREAPEPWPE